MNKKLENTKEKLKKDSKLKLVETTVLIGAVLSSSLVLSSSSSILIHEIIKGPKTVQSEIYEPNAFETAGLITGTSIALASLSMHSVASNKKRKKEDLEESEQV